MARSPLHQDASPSRQDIPPALSIVIVNYNSWQDVDRLVAALVEAPEVGDGQCEVIVVDNASDGPIPPRLAAPPAGVRLSARADNGGFAVGVNTAWRLARGRRLLLLNPDIVAGPDLPGRILERIQQDERQPEGKIGIVGFGLRDPSGRRQPSVGIDPTLFHSLGGLFLPRRRRKYQSGSRCPAGSVPWVTGACALVDSRLLRELGGMDEDFFLYYEEVALCRAARRLGWRVEYDPRIEVIHLNPLQNRPITPMLRVITRHSKLLYFRKFLPAWEFHALSRIVEAEAVVRGLLARLRRWPVALQSSRTMGEIARRMRRGELVLGREVRDRTLTPAAAIRDETGSCRCPGGPRAGFQAIRDR